MFNSSRRVCLSSKKASTYIIPSVCQITGRSLQSRFVSTIVLDEVKDILPPKGKLKLYLFQNRVPLSFSKVMNTYASCWGPNEEELPQGVKGSDLIKLKAILEIHRKQTGTAGVSSLQLESNLIERAAEMGDFTAIALLSGKTMLTTPAGQTEESEQDKEDKLHAMKLLNQLCDEFKFPLAFKIKGDIAYKYGSYAKAAALYQQCLDYLPFPGSKKPIDPVTGKATVIDTNTVILQTECYRNVGLIFLRGDDIDIDQAKLNFEMAIISAEQEAGNNPAQAMDCHFYLAQICADTDRHKARFHFEQAARYGLKEAFAPLGFLLLNYFNRPELAKEWFNLGASIGDLISLVGQFDLAISESDYTQARKSLDAMTTVTEALSKHDKEGEDSWRSYNELLKTRAASIEKLKSFEKENKSEEQSQPQPTKELTKEVPADPIENQEPKPKSKNEINEKGNTGEGRWGF